MNVTTSGVAAVSLAHTRRIPRSLLGILISIAIALGINLGTSAIAEASPVTVSGTVTCLNSYVVGVWIQAESSTSGWATWSMPYRLGGLSQADYSFKLNKGGRYQVHVGCGGTQAKWANNLKSPYVSGTRNSFKCNDIPPNPLAWVLSQGVPSGHSKKV